MQQITVAYKDIELINNHECLFPSTIIRSAKLKEDCKVILHNNPICSVAGLEVTKNYDFVISTTPLTDCVRNTVMPRYSKPQQMAQLTEVAVSSPDQFPNFMQVRSWSDMIALKNDTSSYKLDQIVIKYINGARGICQLLVSGLTDVNKSTVFRDFKMTMDRFSAQPDSSTDALSYNSLMREFFIKDFPYTAQWTGIEQTDYPNRHTFQYTGGYFVQEFVSDIGTEFRVLVGVDGEIHFFKRGLREDRPFPQATGNHKSIYSTHVTGIGFLLSKEITDFLLHVIPQMNSADLFIVSTPKGVKYGVFEFCNQFGTDTDDPEIFKTMHENFILHLAARYRPELFVNPIVPVI